ncbi:unnamed protein product, partial [Darwinula stevensoni]
MSAERDAASYDYRRSFLRTCGLSRSSESWSSSLSPEPEKRTRRLWCRKLTMSHIASCTIAVASTMGSSDHLRFPACIMGHRFPFPLLSRFTRLSLTRAPSSSKDRASAKEKHEGEDVVVCCHENQITAMVDGLSIPNQFLRGCPSCYRNFRQHICYLACSPVQSTFLKDTKGFPSDEKPGQMAVGEMDYYISEAYVYGTHDSCDNVHYGPALLALTLLCGGNQDCTPHDMFNYLGNISNGQAPFQINYLYQTEDEVNGFKPMNATIVECSEPVDPDA